MIIIILPILIILIIYLVNNKSIISEKFTLADDVRNSIDKTFDLDLTPIKKLIDQVDLYTLGTKTNFANSGKLLPNKILNVSGSLYSDGNIASSNLKVGKILASNNVIATTIKTTDASGQEVLCPEVSCNNIIIKNDTGVVSGILNTNNITFKKNNKTLDSYEEQMNKYYDDINNNYLNNVSTTDNKKLFYQDDKGQFFINNDINVKNITANNITANSIKSDIINSNILDVNKYRFYKNKDSLSIGQISDAKDLNNNTIINPSLILNPLNDNRALLLNKKNDTIVGYNFTTNNKIDQTKVLSSKYPLIYNNYNTRGMPIYDTLKEDGTYNTSTIASNQTM